MEWEGNENLSRHAKTRQFHWGKQSIEKRDHTPCCEDRRSFNGEGGGKPTARHWAPEPGRGVGLVIVSTKTKLSWVVERRSVTQGTLSI